MSLPSRACRCRQCRQRDTQTFARIVATSYSPFEVRTLERRATSALVADLETIYAAPALASRSKGVRS